MPLTHFPNGITARTSSASSATSAGAGDIDCQDMFSAGTTSAATITAADGSTYGHRVPIGIQGTAGLGADYVVALTSAIFVTAATANVVAPFKALAEIVWVAGATGSVTASIRVTQTSVSTGAAVTTLSVGSATTEASTVYTTIGGTALTQGSDFTVTSAVMATANSSQLMVNLIPVI